VTPVVSLEGVRVVAADRVLLDVPRLVIDQGERVAIVGPNGAGKSTLLKLIGALIPALHGRVQVLGREIRLQAGPLVGSNLGPNVGPAGAGPAGRLKPADRRALRRETGLLMQGLHLVPRLTARENVLIGALARLRGAEAWRSCCRWYPQHLIDEADAALAALGLADRAETRADRLSGGERQKVALARIQLQRARLLLADEPTSALDPAATQQVCQALLALASEPGCTLVTVVHDLDLLPMLATRVIGMAEGRLCWDRPIADVVPSLLQALYERRTGEATHATPFEPAVMAILARA
jgi:phosphonate transport system ATP-binding protein